MMKVRLHNWERICTDFEHAPCTMLELMRRHGVPHERKRRVFRELQKRSLDGFIVPPATSKPGRAPRAVESDQVERLRMLVRNAGSARKAAAALGFDERTFRRYASGARALPADARARLDALAHQPEPAPKITSSADDPDLREYVARAGSAALAASSLGISRMTLNRYQRGVRELPPTIKRRVAVGLMRAAST